MKRIYSMVTVLLLWAPVGKPLAYGLPPLSAGTLTYRYDFSRGWAGSGWTGDWSVVPGYPKVPLVTARILLPYGQTVAAITVRPVGKAERRASWPFLLIPPAKSMCGERLFPSEPHRFGPDEAYPRGDRGELSLVRKDGYRIAMIPLYPVRGLPARGRSWIARGVEVSLRLVPEEPSPLYRGLAADREETSKLVDNPALFSTYPVLRTAETEQYLAIAPQQFLDDSDPSSLGALLAEKRARGITTATLSTESIDAGVPGQDLQEKIRNAIIQHYRRGGVRWVLLVGNGYSMTPTRTLTVDGMEGGNIPTDMYFACLDGKPTRADRKTGDTACEVAVGRAPVSGLADLHAFVAKTLKMEAIPEADSRIWGALSYGEKMDDSTLGSKLIEKLATGGTAGSVATVGYPAATQFTRMYETFTFEYAEKDVVAALGSGRYYTVNHLGHAMETECMHVPMGSIPQITNELPFFGITQSCLPGNLDGPNWASTLVVSPVGGAAAMVANSREGFYFGSGSDDGPSNHFHLIFYDTVWREGLRDLGHIQMRTKERMIPEVSTSELYRWIVYETNLLGDPELRLKFPAAPRP